MRMRSLLLVSVFLITSFYSCISINEESNILFDYQVNGKAYEILLPDNYNSLRAKYDYIGDFTYGMAKVRQGEKYGLIDHEGNLAVPCKYSSIGDCDTLRQWVGVTIKEKHNKYNFDIKKHGFISMSTGKEIVPCQYFIIKEFSEDLALVETHDNMYGYIDNEGKIAIPIKFRRENTDGLSIIQTPISNFYDGKAVIAISRENDNYYGYIDNKGEVIIPCIYSNATSFRDGIASVRLEGKDIYIDSNGKQITPPDGYNKWGFINKQGKTVIPLEYDMANNFRCGFAKIFKNGRYGYINQRGNVLGDIQYDTANDFDNDVAIVKKDNKAGYLKADGTLILSNKFEVIWSFSEGLAAVKVGDKWGFMNISGNIAIPLIYSQIGSFSDGLAFASIWSSQDLKLKYGYINKQGQIIIPFQYEHAMPFSEGLAPVKKKEKWGFVDINDKVIIDFKYDGASPFSSGVASVKINEQWISINKRGEIIAKEAFLSNDLNPVKKGNKWGYVDCNGNIIIPFEYEQAMPFSEGLACVKKEGKYGYIDEKGEVLIPFIYQFARNFTNGLAAVQK